VTITFLGLVINMKTAKTPGIEVPEALLATADELIKCVSACKIDPAYCLI